MHVMSNVGKWSDRLTYFQLDSDNFPGPFKAFR